MVVQTSVRLFEGARAALLGHDIISRWKSHSPIIAVIEFKNVATSTAIETQIGTAAAAEFTGVTTPATVNFKAADAKDTLTGVGLQYVANIGVQAVAAASSADAVIRQEIIALTGATVKASSKYMIRQWVFHPFQVGSEKDNAGAITMTDAAATYLTLTAASGCSNGNFFYIPTGWAACVYRAEYNALSAPAPTSSIMAKLKVRYEDFLEDPYNATTGASATQVSDEFSVGTYSSPTGIVSLRQIPLKGSTANGARISFWESYVNATSSYNVKFFMLLLDCRSRSL
jgi:hypothetical protein